MLPTGTFQGPNPSLDRIILDHNENVRKITKDKEMWFVMERERRGQGKWWLVAGEMIQ